MAEFGISDLLRAGVGGELILNEFEKFLCLGDGICADRAIVTASSSPQSPAFRNY
ncbi:hypothetical protein IQ270_05455 [Microcoleus sp. LEGE 07076]|nr:hypothetical protein [Microcoleus sp. LEGE 07076]